MFFCGGLSASIYLHYPSSMQYVRKYPVLEETMMYDKCVVEDTGCDLGGGYFFNTTAVSVPPGVFRCVLCILLLSLPEG